MSLLWPSRDERMGELCERARRGDRKAFRALYGELYEPVMTYVGRRVRSREDAEDLTARVFMRLLERFPEIDTKKGSIQMFVTAMARNAVIDYRRARRRGGEQEADENALLDGAETPLDTLMREEQMEQIKRALSELPSDTREMLELRYGEGLRHKEIAELLGVQEAAVKQRFSRTLRWLKDKLGRAAFFAKDSVPKESGSAGKEAGAETGDGYAPKGAMSDVR